ncbi:hypothetical protein N7E02_21290 [Aliirhizobium terrae]|uniref:hypothetical protein n=1 Tax=Terrirhizobium terrae TaxID=2926709 RepID=UPI002575191B|nr:hypothetical protein [Rhizobium sp. CC-CFT758]WJH39360.1 hypothetical protein N7E02_21290 [Rhizobium sp. CC-CFT758]
MAEIVVMTVWRDRNRRKLEANRMSIGASEGTGEVVLFTGVRYERYDDRTDRAAENHAVR